MGKKFWWYNAETPFPKTKKDVFGDQAGSCKTDQPVCFQKLPGGLNEAKTEIMAADSVGTVYKWRFDPSNKVAHASFLAMQQGKDISHGAVGSAAWNPTVLKGKSHPTHQDSVMYRKQDGIKSFLLDDDKCDCKSTLSLGHAMCGTGCSQNYGDCKIPGGVDILRDDGCRGPNHKNGLAIYFRVLPYQGVEVGLEGKYGGGWKKFWWYNAGTPFPKTKKDVFGDKAGSCKPDQPVCFQKLPGGLNEAKTEIMAADSVGTVYKWRFDP